MNAAEMSAGWEDRSRLRDGEAELVEDKHVQRLCENAYRRGFVQGAEAALAVVAARPANAAKRWRDELDAWVARLRYWRSKLHKGRWEEPERLTRTANGVDAKRT